MRRIYLDYAAATPIDPAVKAAMDAAEEAAYANPGGLHREAAASKTILEDARKRVAQVLNCRSDEIVFTSGGTESNNLAILGRTEYLRASGRAREDCHIITSKVEHSSVREAVRHLESLGYPVSWLGVTEEGNIDLHEFEAALRETTSIVSLLAVNNETGAVQPLRAAAKALRKFRRDIALLPKTARRDRLIPPLFHTDAVQSPLYLPLDLERTDLDLVSIDGGKIYGPCGAGVLFVRRKAGLLPLVYGGSQERGRRPGTEHVAAAVGMAVALERASKMRESEGERLAQLRKYFWQGIQQLAPEALLNGTLEASVPGILNVSFPGVDSEFLLIALDEFGVACSTKSACLTNDEQGSYVVAALPGGEARSRSSIRFSFGRSTTKSELARALAVLEKSLRGVSTLR
jgi:cysteine desulfurase